MDTIPGVDRRIAECLIAEIGVDMGRFATSARLASWAGMCPGNHESGGKRNREGPARAPSGSPPTWLRPLRPPGARRTPTSAPSSPRLRGRIGHAKARKAVEHSMLVAAFHILAGGVPYTDLGADWFQKRRPEAHARRLAHQIEALGYRVTIEAGRTRPDRQLSIGTSSRAGLRPAPRPRAPGYRVFGSDELLVTPMHSSPGLPTIARASGVMRVLNALQAQPLRLHPRRVHAAVPGDGPSAEPGTTIQSAWERIEVFRGHLQLHRRVGHRGGRVLARVGDLGDPVDHTGASRDHGRVDRRDRGCRPTRLQSRGTGLLGRVHRRRTGPDPVHRQAHHDRCQRRVRAVGVGFLRFAQPRRSDLWNSYVNANK